MTPTVRDILDHADRRGWHWPDNPECELYKATQRLERAKAEAKAIREWFEAMKHQIQSS